MEAVSEQLKKQLEEVWERWLAFSAYAQKHKNRNFFKHFCIYVVSIWNKADADSQFLRQMYIGSSHWSTEINPKTNVNIDHWQRIFGEDVYEILQLSDLELHPSLQAFLFQEYCRICELLRSPLPMQAGLARKMLPEKMFPDVLTTIGEEEP